MQLLFVSRGGLIIRAGSLRSSCKNKLLKSKVLIYEG